MNIGYTRIKLNSCPTDRYNMYHRIMNALNHESFWWSMTTFFKGPVVVLETYTSSLFALMHPFVTKFYFSTVNYNLVPLRLNLINRRKRILKGFFFRFYLDCIECK